MKRLLAFFFFLAIAFPAFAVDDVTFTKANNDFAARRFDAAIAGYQQLVASGKWSATLFYNLGNAYYRAGEFGKAVLQFERALALEPRHAEAEANLRLAREQARALELRETELQRYARFATANQHTIAAAVALWMSAFFIAAAVLRGRTVKRIGLAFVGLAVFGIAATAAYQIETGPRGTNVAIVTASGAEARLATADSASAVLTLPPGSEVKVLSTRGEWIYATLPNDSRGWIRTAAVERVRL